MGDFVVRLHGKKTKMIFYKQLPLNENDNEFEGELNDINNKRTVMNLYDVEWQTSFYTSTDVSMLGNGCGMYQYPQFYYLDLEQYQVL